MAGWVDVHYTALAQGSPGKSSGIVRERSRLVVCQQVLMKCYRFVIYPSQFVSVVIDTCCDVV